MAWFIPLIFAAAGAAAGGTAGIFGTKNKKDRDTEAIRRQKENARKQAEYEKLLREQQFNISKGEAMYQLDAQDRELREGMNQFTDEYNAALLGSAFGARDLRIQTDADIGMSMVNEGASGTRGNEANDLMRAFASSSAEDYIGLQKKQEENALSGTVNAAGRAIAAMGHEKASWEPGGWRHEMKDAQDTYSDSVFDLGQDHFDWMLEQYEFKNMWMDYVTAFLSGGQSGANSGYSAYSYYKDWNTMFKGGD